MVYRRIAFAVVLAFATVAHAQSFNIDVGFNGSAPSSSYAAAGLPGVWNVVQIPHITPFMTAPHPNAEHLVDLNGNSTSVVIHQFGGMDLNQVNDEQTVGDDEALMDDYLATHSVSLESCVYVNGLRPGKYEVTTYAMMPNSPNTISKIRFDFSSNIPLIGGGWAGFHEEGITFARHILTVTSSGSTTFIGAHIGVPSGGNTTIGAPLNGIQIRQLPSLAPGDMNCDGLVDGEDIDDFVMALLDESAYRDANPTCNIYHGDMNNNGSVGPEDIAQFIALLF